MLVQCPECDRQITVTPRLAGRKVKCKCGTLMRMPQMEPAAVGSVASAPPPAPAPTPPPFQQPPQTAGDIQFECPSCYQRLSVPTSAAGQITQCPCGTQLYVPQPTTVPADDPFALPNELASPDLQPLDTIEEVGLEPIPNDPFAAAPGPPPLTTQAYGATSTPAYLQAGGTASGGKRKVKRKTVARKKDNSSSGVSASNQILGGFGLMVLGVFVLLARLANNRISITGPILIISGIVGVIRGFIDPD